MGGRTKVIACLSLASMLYIQAVAQMPAYFKKKKPKQDTFLVYNPYPEAYSMSMDRKDTFRASPKEMIINWADELKLAAPDGTPMGATAFAMNISMSPQPKIQMYKYISTNMLHPQPPKKVVHGIVVVSFRLDGQGHVLNPTVFKSVSPTIDSEAVRLISSMAWWMPNDYHDYENRMLIRF